VAWENVDHRAMAGFIRFYIFDEQQSKKLRLRERHAQTINAIVYTLAFGGDTEDARALIKTLGQRAMSMMPSERAATLALLPELEPMLK
jgi:isochorismate hydrolase